MFPILKHNQAHTPTDTHTQKKHDARPSTVLEGLSVIRHMRMRVNTHNLSHERISNYGMIHPIYSDKHLLTAVEPKEKDREIRVKERPGGNALNKHTQAHPQRSEEIC